MRKYLSLILVVMLSLFVATSVYAEVTFTRGPDARVLTYTLSQTTTVTDTGIGTYNRLLGFTYSDSAAGAVALADFSTASEANLLTYLIGEAYVAAGTSTTIMFPLPRSVTYGIFLKMNTATGTAIVYYE